MIYTYDMLQIAGAVFNQGSGAERRALKLAIKSFSAAVGTSSCMQPLRLRHGRRHGQAEWPTIPGTAAETLRLTQLCNGRKKNPAPL